MYKFVLQAELGVLDRVAFSSEYSYNSCLQAINGEFITSLCCCPCTADFLVCIVEYQSMIPSVLSA